jgi:hypothetical protein
LADWLEREREREREGERKRKKDKEREKDRERERKREREGERKRERERKIERERESGHLDRNHFQLLPSRFFSRHLNDALFLAKATMQLASQHCATATIEHDK